MTTPKFKNSPITEALFDIQIDPHLSVTPKELEAAHFEVIKDYPEKKARRLWETKLELRGEQGLQTQSEDKGILGYQFWSNDQRQVVQFRLDGYSYSRLKPYEAWEKSFPEALRGWQIYVSKFKPTSIKRIALRYINVIEIPSTKVELNDYFTNPPQPAGDLPQVLDSFISRMVIRFDDSTSAVMTLTPHPATKPNTHPVLFDIDVFSNVQFPASYEKLNDEFERLHGVVWKVFKKSIKPKTEELFNQ